MKALIVAASIILLSACGGGGGDGSSVTQAQKLSITQANARQVLEAAYFANDIEGEVFGTIINIAEMLDGNQTFPCDLGGTESFTMSLQTPEVITAGDSATLSFVDCVNDEGNTSNGTVDLTVESISEESVSVNAIVDLDFADDDGVQSLNSIFSMDVSYQDSLFVIYRGSKTLTSGNRTISVTNIVASVEASELGVAMDFSGVVSDSLLGQGTFDFSLSSELDSDVSEGVIRGDNSTIELTSDGVTVMAALDVNNDNVVDETLFILESELYDQ